MRSSSGSAKQLRKLSCVQKRPTFAAPRARTFRPPNRPALVSTPVSLQQLSHIDRHDKTNHGFRRSQSFASLWLLRFGSSATNSHLDCGQFAYAWMTQVADLDGCAMVPLTSILLWKVRILMPISLN
jgi:hypothetical protein